jgi:hypothetical protein
MFKLKDYIIESKNVHMEHLEDLVFNEGVAGTRKAINFLQDLRDLLAGNSKTKLTATVKWDGAPAIFVGVDPRDGKFFVAKKGIFNVDPKIYKTVAEIDTDLSGDLAAKFKVALSEFSKLGIKRGVYQGDLMFTKGDLKTQTIEGQKYLTFHPNTIVYAIPHGSDLANKINKAKIGVVWHTTYTGNSFTNMTASFGKNITSQFNQPSSVWMDDATYKDYSGTASFTAAETQKVTNILSEAGQLFNKIDAAVINSISKDQEILNLIKTYNNAKVRIGEKITNPVQHVVGLYHWIQARYNKEMNLRKTDKGRDQWKDKINNMNRFFAGHSRDAIADVFRLTNLLVDAKHMIINKMNEAGHIETFLKTSSGFKVTGVEGFVAIDRLSGGAVKIVNRMEFSKANFSADVIKGWEH